MGPRSEHQIQSPQFSIYSRAKILPRKGGVVYISFLLLSPPGKWHYHDVIIVSMSFLALYKLVSTGIQGVAFMSVFTNN